MYALFSAAALTDAKLHMPPETCDGMCAVVLKIIRRERASSSWRKYYGAVATFVQNRLGIGNVYNVHNLQTTIVEVGTCFGGNSLTLSGSFPFTLVFAVDPFLGGYDILDVQSNKFLQATNSLNITKEMFSKTWADALTYDLVKKNEKSRFGLLHDSSLSAALEFKNSSIDFLFIDGLHTYQGVRDDVKAWSSKMRNGGIIMFNDYEPGGGFFPGVKKAADEFANNSRLHLHCCIRGNNAWVQLPY